MPVLVKEVGLATFESGVVLKCIGQFYGMPYTWAS